MPKPIASKEQREAIGSEVKAGKETIEAIAARHGIPAATVRQWAKRFGWVTPNIVQVVKREVARRITPDVVQPVTDVVSRTVTDLSQQLVTEAESWVRDTRKRMSRYRSDLDKTREQMDPAADPDALRAMAQTEKVVDDVARRSLGLEDAEANKPVQVAVILNVPPMTKEGEK